MAGEATRSPQQLEAQLQRQRIATALLSVCLAAALGVIGYDRQEALRDVVAGDFHASPQPLPFRQEIEAIVEPLKYSGLAALTRPDVSLTIDFTRQVWQLRNIHRFDAQGNLLLEGGRSGQCGELAAYTYQKIRPLFDKRYAIDFLQVAQSSYFPAPRAGHYILRISDAAASPRVFFLDPAFQRYGPPEEFEDYLFFEPLPILDFMANRDPDVTFRIGEGSPVVIGKQRMVTLAVEGRQGRFGPQDFSVSLVATRRYHYASRPIYMLGRLNGRRQEYEDTALAEAVLEPAAYGRLRARINEWVGRLADER